jgi:hypothetical protein
LKRPAANGPSQNTGDYDVTISQAAKVIVAIALGITAIISGVKSLADAAKNLNGWHVLFIVSLFVLLVLGIDFCKGWLDAQFASVRREIGTQVANEERNRTAWVNSIQNQHSDLRLRIEKMEAWFKSKNVPL